MKTIVNDRFRRKVQIARLILAIVSFLFWWFCYRPIEAQRRWDDRINNALRVIEKKRPPDMSPERWEFLFVWTWNMHCNCACTGQKVDLDWRDGYAAELERRASGTITVADIDWMWDEFVQHTKAGPSYDRYRPTREKDAPFP